MKKLDPQNTPFDHDYGGNNFDALSFIWEKKKSNFDHDYGGSNFDT